MSKVVAYTVRRIDEFVGIIGELQAPFIVPACGTPACCTGINLGLIRASQ